MRTLKGRGACRGLGVRVRLGVLVLVTGLAGCGLEDDEDYTPDDLMEGVDAALMMEAPPEPMGDSLCDALEPAIDVGEPCVTSGPCGRSGLCFPDGPSTESCHQVCVPDRCDARCPEGTACVDVSEEVRRLRLTVRALPLDAPVGVCQPIPEPLPPYGTCGPGLPGVCPEGTDCVYFNPREGLGYCAPPCEGSNVPCEDGIGTCGLNAYGGPRRAQDRYCAVPCPERLDAACPADLRCGVFSGVRLCRP